MDGMRTLRRYLPHLVVFISSMGDKVFCFFFPLYSPTYAYWGYLQPFFTELYSLDEQKLPGKVEVRFGIWIVVVRRWVVSPVPFRSVRKRIWWIETVDLFNRPRNPLVQRSARRIVFGVSLHSVSEGRVHRFHLLVIRIEIDINRSTSSLSLFITNKDLTTNDFSSHLPQR